MNTDRNLLFGALAFQNDYIDLVQFSAVCRAWAADKSRPMGDLLVDKGWLDQAGRAELDRMVERRLRRYGGDVRATLGAVADHAVRDAMRDVADDELRQSLASLPPAAGHVILETLVKPSQNRSRYTLSRLHGQGGLGKVWVARDGDLQREVALKELRPEHGTHPEACQRFLMEAQVTGQLEHPNIVPVYELSRRPEDDQPFYTMRFVRGQTLGGAIAEHHRRERQGAEHRVELARLLQVLISVCNAIGYAHSRGVVHRDLKPENVVLGAYGEVIVLDWGLAKLVHEPAEPAAATVDVPVAVRPDVLTGMTVAGRVLGTPAYMSPEQAEGRIDLVDSRSDVFGLGAILYEILTGHPPHGGSDTAAMLSQIISGATPHARAASPSVPPALDAVCAKAMAKSRQERYASAAELARDVERWLADEPVSCYRDAWIDRAGRWARRHRTATLAVSVVVLAVAVASTVAAILIDRARQRELAARNESRRLMKEFRNSADSLLSVVGTGLKSVPGGQRLRLPLLEEAARAFELFYGSEPQDAELQIEWALALLRLGRARFEVGDDVGAEQTVHKAQAILENLTADLATDPARQLLIATSQVDLGILYVDRGRPGDAERALRSAVQSLARLDAARPKSEQIRAALARAQVQLGNTLRDQLKYDEAEPLLRATITTHQQLAEAAPGEPAHVVALATSYKSLGDLLRDAGRAEAIDAYRAAIEESQLLVAAAPEIAEYRERLAASRLHYGEQLFGAGRWVEAAEFYQAAADELESLVDADPDVTLFHERLAVALHNRGVVLRALGDHVAAESVLRRALEEFTALVRFQPRFLTHHTGLAHCRISLGQILRDTGRNRDARDVLQTASAELQALPNDVLTLPAVQHAVLVARSNLGWTLFKLGEQAEAEAALHSAVANGAALVQDHPHVAAFAEAQAWRLHRLGDMLHDKEDADEAIRHYGESRALRERLAMQHGDAPDHAYKLAWLLATCRDPRVRDPEQAVRWARQAVDRVPSNATYCTALAAAYLAQQNAAAAIEWLDAARRHRGADEPTTCLFLAIALAELERPADARVQLERGIESLRSGGFDEPELLQLAEQARRRVPRDP